MPSLLRARMRSSTCSTSRTASAAVGSSMMTSFGLKVSARAIATDCCWPPESWPVICVTEGMRAPSLAIIASASLRMRLVSMNRTPRIGARQLPAEEDVRGDVAHAGEREILVDHLDAGLTDFAGILADDRDAVEADRRRRRDDGRR